MPKHCLQKLKEQQKNLKTSRGSFNRPGLAMQAVFRIRIQIARLDPDPYSESGSGKWNWAIKIHFFRKIFMIFTYFKKWYKIKVLCLIKYLLDWLKTKIKYLLFGFVNFFYFKFVFFACIRDLDWKKIQDPDLQKSNPDPKHWKLGWCVDTVYYYT